MGRLIHKHCPDQALFACSTANILTFNFFMSYIIHSTESTLSNKNVLLEQAKHSMPEGLKLLSHCCGDRGESQKQTEVPRPQLLPSCPLLCLQTEHLYIQGSEQTTLSDKPHFPHISIHLTGAVTWHHNRHLSLASVRCFTECVLPVCHFPVPFLA